MPDSRVGSIQPVVTTARAAQAACTDILAADFLDEVRDAEGVSLAEP